MQLSTLCERYDARLRLEAFAELDASANGLQVGRLDRRVEHVAFAVDAAVETIDAATAAGADVLVVHHGLSWGGIERLTGRRYERIARLVEADLALYAVHLPLDAHETLGNAAGVAEVLGLRHRDPFGTLGGETVGIVGECSPCGVDELAARLAADLDHGEDGGVRTLPFGPERVTDVAVVTGSGADWFDEAVDAGVDAFVTGEGKARLYHDAREAGVHVLLAGHYATETFGVRALQGLAAEWDLETTFIKVPTGL